MINIELDISINTELYEDEIDYLENDKISDFIKYIVSNEKKDNKTYYVSLTITNNEEIHKINKEYRDKDMETDVISFAYFDSEEANSNYMVLGDIIISIDKVRTQSIEYNHSKKREFYYLICHSVLHLLGYDHLTEEDKKIMREKEEIYLEKYKINR